MVYSLSIDISCASAQLSITGVAGTSTNTALICNDCVVVTFTYTSSCASIFKVVRAKVLVRVSPAASVIV